MDAFIPIPYISQFNNIIHENNPIDTHTDDSYVWGRKETCENLD